ncbi:MAG TPA: hypothetical protein EYG92_01520 [Lutibacter sp.]|nr:hypothetical protein [Lutibacter sp.]
MKKLLCILFLFTSLLSYTQQVNLKSFEYKNQKLKKVLSDIEQAFEVKFSYIDKVVADKKISIEKDTFTLTKLIEIISTSTSLTFERIDARYFAVYEKDENQELFNDNQLLSDVVIHAYLTKGISKNKDNSFTIVPQELSILPGLTEPDVLQTLQQLPGVVSPNETVTGLHVRGGTPDQNLLLWNGIQIYHSGHLFGMISGFNSNVDQSIRFYNKGTDPIYGGRIASVIAIETSDKIPNKTEVSAGVNMLNLDANISIPIIKKKLKLQVSGRRSFTDLLESFTYANLFQKVFQNTKIAAAKKDENIFYFRDYNAKLQYQVTNKTAITISSIFIDNKLDNLYANENNDVLFNDMMTLSNEGYSIKWATKWSNKFVTTAKAFYSDYIFDYDFVKIYELNDTETFTKRNKVLDSGVSFHIDYHINKNTLLNTGYQYVAQDVSHAFVSKTPALSIVYDSKASFIQTHSIYSSLKYHKNKIIALNAGARLSYITSLDKLVFEPRFVLNYQINPQLNANITGEVKNQTISQIQETIVNDLGLENQLWRISDSDRFPLLNAKQITTGLSFSKNKWTLDIDAYFKTTKGLTTLTFGFLNNLDPNFHIGESKAYGLDFYMKKDFSKLKTWMTYSFNSTMNKFENLNNGNLFPVNAEIKHILNTAMSYKHKNWQYALGWYWHSGKPYTQVSIHDNKVIQLAYNKLNGSRLPNYHRLDVSSIWNFPISKSNKVKGKLGFSIYNLYNRKNILNREYTINEENNSLDVIDRKSLQLNPNVFFRVSF